MDKLIIIVGLIVFVCYLGKPLFLSDEEYRKYYEKRFYKNILGKSFEKEMKSFKTVQKIMFWSFLIVTVIVTALVILLWRN